MSQKTKILNKLQSMDAQYHHQTNPSSEDNDQEYDNLREVYEEHFEESYPHVGAPVPKDRRCLLPFYMGSLDKVTVDKKDLLDKWRVQNRVPSFVLQTKLDGISALYVQKFHQKPRLYTRGDGKEGTDITHLVPLLASSLPSPNLKEGEELVVRGEIIMSHTMFQKKYSKTFKNSRNLVSGIVHSKVPSPDLLQDICFIAYEDLSRPRSPMDQIDALQKWGFQTVFCKLISASVLSLELLEKEWEDWPRVFPMDGLVLLANVPQRERCTQGNPSYAIAFKKNHETKFVRVVKVHWNVSKHNILKPRIEIFPVEQQGVTITFLTGFNARYIKDNKIGPDAILEITRSGEVIPHILRVVESTNPQLPERCFTWNETGVDIILNEDGPQNEALVEQICFFLKTVGIKGLAQKTVEKIVQKGHDSIPKLLHLSFTDLRAVPLGEVESQNMHDAIHKSGRLDNMDLAILLTATGFFGMNIGLKKIQRVLYTYPDVLVLGKKLSRNDLLEKIANVSGWSSKSAEGFVDGIPRFEKFLEACPSITILSEQRSVQKSEKNMVWTGFRDSILAEKMLNGYALSLSENVNCHTQFVVARDPSKITSKIKKAIELGIEIFDEKDFRKKYE